jgi:hypothetical protein
MIMGLILRFLMERATGNIHFRHYSSGTPMAPQITYSQFFRANAQLCNQEKMGVDSGQPSGPVPAFCKVQN